MISRFRVENYKLLSRVDIPLTPIHVIVGQNDSGKTSLLEAISAFCRSAEPGRQVAQLFGGKWQGRELVFMGSAKPTIDFEAQLDGRWQGRECSVKYGFQLQFTFPAASDCIVASEWSIDIDRKNISSSNSSTGVSNVNSMNQLEHARLGLDKIAGLIGESGFYRFEPRMMALPAAFDPTRRNRMDPDGFGLPTLLDDIVGNDAEKFVAMSKEFCRFLPEFRRVRLETEDGNQRNYQPNGLHTWGRATGKGIHFETAEGGTIRAQQASDGALLFLGFLSLLYAPNPPKVLLIEEPEKGVYPKRLAEIIGLLKRMIDDPGGREIPQIILTTHSPYVLSQFRPEEVTLMSRQGDHAIARPLRDAPHIQERLAGGEFYLGELWYNLDEEELFQDVQAERRD